MRTRLSLCRYCWQMTKTRYKTATKLKDKDGNESTIGSGAVCTKCGRDKE